MNQDKPLRVETSITKTETLALDLAEIETALSTLLPDMSGSVASLKVNWDVASNGLIRGAEVVRTTVQRSRG